MVFMRMTVTFAMNVQMEDLASETKIICLQSEEISVTYERYQVKHGIAKQRADGNGGEQIEYVVEGNFVEKRKSQKAHQRQRGHDQNRDKPVHSV